MINRGFGGTQIVDATHFAERLIFPHRPRRIFLRAGGNDLNAGKTAEQVFADFQEFAAKIHAKLPQAEIVFISLSPSIARIKQADWEKALNEMVQRFAADQPLVRYVETYDMVLGPDGMPREELFVADTAPHAVALARQAHPEDGGLLLRYIPREKLERVYAYPRPLETVR